jgi:hypothetical protein
MARGIDTMFMLLRGIGPHFHPRLESSGVVGVDPPHLRWICRVGCPRVAGGAWVPVDGGVEREGVADRGEGARFHRSPSYRGGTPVDHTCTCWVLIQHFNDWRCRWHTTGGSGPEVWRMRPGPTESGFRAHRAQPDRGGSWCSIRAAASGPGAQGPPEGGDVL